MKCPKCGDELQTLNRHGVRIEHCPSCQGKWLDQGELERLLRRMSMLERNRCMRTGDTGKYPAL